MAFSPSDGACQKATRPCPRVCQTQQVARYPGRQSGPLLDRMDPQAETSVVAFEDWARGAQRARLGEGAEALNAFVPAPEIRRHSRLDGPALAVLEGAAKAAALSARALDRVLRVGRTIADLPGEPAVTARHLAEALQYRALDRLKKALEDQR